MDATYHLVRFEGVVDISRYPEFRKEFYAVPHGVPTLVDLTLVDSLDSTFLTELLLMKRRHSGQVVILIAPFGHVARIIDIMDIRARLGVFTDLARAVDALGFHRAQSAAELAVE